MMFCKNGSETMGKAERRNQGKEKKIKNLRRLENLLRKPSFFLAWYVHDQSIPLAKNLSHQQAVQLSITDNQRLFWFLNFEREAIARKFSHFSLFPPT